MSNKVFTPREHFQIKQNEVFVFGSNKAGNHVGGAARVAVEKFGAIMGHGEGLQGQSYAIPTLDEQMGQGVYRGIDAIGTEIRRLYTVQYR